MSLALTARRRVLTWGATSKEATSRLPGDELLGDANGVSTRARAGARRQAQSFSRETVGRQYVDLAVEILRRSRQVPARAVSAAEVLSTRACLRLGTDQSLR